MLRKHRSEPKPDVVPAENPFLFFISSDMSDEYMSVREEVVRRIDDAPYLSRYAFEYSPGGSEPIDSEYLRKVRECDLFIWILTNHTPFAVRNEIHEAISSSKDFWLIDYESDEPEDSTQEIKARVGNRCHWISVTDSGVGAAVAGALHDEIVRALRKRPGLSREATIAQRMRESRGRCIARWGVIGIPETVASRLFEDKSLGHPPSRLVRPDGDKLRVLIGKAGSGKSLIAERLFQYRLAKSMESASEPVPVFLEAKRIRKDLESEIFRASSGIGDPSYYGAHIILDGLDEVDSTVAVDLLHELRVVVEKWNNSISIVTSRPIPGAFAAHEQVDVEQLPEDVSLNLLSLFGARGSQLHQRYSWPKSVSEASKFPLYALLIGRYLSENEDSRLTNSAQLLHYLGSSIVRYLANQDERALVEVAQQATSSAKELIEIRNLSNPDQYDHSLPTGVLERDGDSIGFTNTLVREWFASRALSLGIESLDNILSDTERVYRWWYPVLLYLKSSSDAHIRESLLLISQQNPVFAMGLIPELFVDPDYDNLGNTDAPSNSDAACELKSILDAFSKGFGSYLDSTIGITTIDGAPLEIGTHIHGAQFYRMYRRSPGGVFVVNTQDSPPSDSTLGHWDSYSWSTQDWTAGWAWSATHRDIQRYFESWLSKSQVPLKCEVLRREELWYQVLHVMGRSVHHHTPIPAADVLRRLRLYSDNSIISFDGMHLPIREFRGQLVAITQSENPNLSSPYTGPDLNRRGKWVWSDYSGYAMLKRVEEVYTAALYGYLCIVEEWPENIKSQMNLYMISPCEMVLDLVYEDKDDGSSNPSLTYYLKPIERNLESRVDAMLNHRRVSFSDFDLTGHQALLRRLRPQHWQRVRTLLYNGGPTITKKFPARQLALKWIAEDLEAIKVINSSSCVSEWR